MKMRSGILVVIAVLIAVSTTMAWGEDVPKWSVKEILLSASGSYSNPYTQTSVTARFISPTGKRMTVFGFWNGGGDWRVRFAPTETGNWSWSTSSSDPGLNAQSGSFTCVAPAPGNHGFLRRDPDHSTNFRWDDGTHAFIWGQTYYELIRNARAGNAWQTAVSQSKGHGMNKVRFLIYPWSNTERSYPDSQPFTGSLFTPDHDRLNLAHWQKLDEVIRYMESRGVIADLIIFADDPRVSGTLLQNQRYLRNVISRFAAFHNVMWCLSNEWEYVMLPCRKDANAYIAPDIYEACKQSFGQNYEADNYQNFFNGIGIIVRNMDPWMAEGAALRPLSIHQSSHHDFSFMDFSWPVHAIIQDGMRNRDPEFRNGDAWGHYGIWMNIDNAMPVVNDEYGYIGDTSHGWTMTRNEHRHCIWGIATAGGYGSAGDVNYLANGNQPYLETDWMDEPEYGDIYRLVNFFTTKGLEYWRMSGHNEWNGTDMSSDIVTGTRVYVLAEPGRQYVVYAAVGGTFSLYLPAGDYTVRRYDPRTGADTALQETAGGGWRRFTLPDSNDWVVYAQLKSTDQPQPAVEPVTLNFLSPQNGQQFNVGDDLYVKVDARRENGTIAGVKLYIDGNVVRQEYYAPYEWGAEGQNDPLLQNMPAGSYELTAMITLDQGATKSVILTSITIHVGAGQPFTVDFLTPQDGETFDEGGDLYVHVDARQSNGAVSSVKLTINGHLVRQEYYAPYEWGAEGQNDPLLQNMTAGDYTLIAEALDAQGVTTSKAIKIHVSGALAGRWSFNEGSGNLTADASGFSNTGTLTNGAFWAPGRLGYAVSLDGADDYVCLTRPVIGNRETFTLTAWFQTQAGDRGTIYNEYDSSGKAQIYLTANEENFGDLEFGMFNDAGQWAGVGVAPIGLNNGAWHHIAVVQYSKAERALFIDGIFRAVDYTPSGTLTLDRAIIGALQAPYSKPRYFAGQIDEVGVYGRALSADEIQNLAAGK